MAHVSDQRRYRDYLPPDSMPAQPPTEDVRPAESAVVMKMSDGSWHAVWQGDTLLGEFDGTREEAVAWARSRSSRCWIYSEELGDLVRDDKPPSRDYQ
jgi:hypothetical protein